MSVRECVQCAAETAAGKRCKKHTCMYSEFCDVHTKKLFDLAIKQSAIAGSGKGLFTMVEIPKNTRIAQYTGQVKTDAEYGEKESGYGISIPGGKVIDAYSTQHGIARYANDCRSANIKKGECKGSNARFSSSTRDGKTLVWLTSTKRIKAGGEIFVSYGRGYWADGETTKTKTKTKTKTTRKEEGKYDDWTTESGNKHSPRVDGKPVRQKKKKKKKKKDEFRKIGSDAEALKEVEALEQARALGRSIYSIKDRGGLDSVMPMTAPAPVSAPLGSVFAVAAQNLGLRLA